MDSSVLSSYQQKIWKSLLNGALIQCSEGINYKTWLIYPDGKREKVRRDSVESLCAKMDCYLKFGEYQGIYFNPKWRKA